MATLLDQLNTMTVVVADTGDLNSIEQVQAARCDDQPVVDHGGGADAGLRGRGRRGAAWAAGQAGGDKARGRAGHRPAGVEFGLRILKIVPGRVSTEVDARLSYDTEATVAKARYLIGSTRRPAPAAIGC
jgi:transaldolase